MKHIITVIVLLAVLAISGGAIAAPVTVDFSVLGIESVGITSPDSYNLDGITFRYDNFGSEIDTAQVDSSGIFGSTNGSLIFDFDAPTTALNFDFSLLGVSEEVSDALFVSFKNGGTDVIDVPLSAGFEPYDDDDPAQGGDAFNTFIFQGAEFDQAIMFFSTDASHFSIGNLSYVSTTAPVPVPEPSGLLALSGGLLALGSLIRRRK